MSSEREALRQPIGFWLRRADELLTRSANAALQSEGVGRFHWQLLNLVSDGESRTSGEVLARMRNFVDAAGLQEMTAELVRRGWLEGEEAARGRLKLTTRGLEAHRRLATTMDSVRQRSTQGISAEEYAQLIRALQRMCANLEADMGAAQ